MKQQENRIRVFKKELDALPFLNSDEMDRLLDDFLVRNTYNSNAMGGNSLTLKETGDVLQGVSVEGKRLDDLLDMICYREAFDYGRELAASGKPLSEAEIRWIHTLVQGGDRIHRGRYRDIPIAMLGVDETFPLPSQVPVMMEKLIQDYLESEEEISTRLAKLHLDFERIHPFRNGNGRTGRLIINLELMKAGYPPIDIPVTDRERYFEAFQSKEKMTDFLSEYIENALREYVALVRQAQDLKTKNN